MTVLNIEIYLSVFLVNDQSLRLCLNITSHGEVTVCGEHSAGHSAMEDLWPAADVLTAFSRDSFSFKALSGFMTNCSKWIQFLASLTYAKFYLTLLLSIGIPLPLFSKFLAQWTLSQKLLPGISACKTTFSFIHSLSDSLFSYDAPKYLLHSHIVVLLSPIQHR